MSGLLRPADNSDVEAVATIHAISRRAYYKAGGVAVPDGAPYATDEYLAFWSQALTCAANRAWIAEESGECVGFMVAGAPVHEDLAGISVLELIALYLLPNVWGMGVADALHEVFVTLLMAAPDAQEGALDVWSGNLRALAFYHRHGWTADGRSRPGPLEQPYVGLRLPAPRPV